MLGTCSFYEMFKLEEVGRYVINVCTDISCMLLGGDQLLHHAEQKLGIKSGQTTPDRQFTVEGVTCIAACTEAPCLQINYRYFHKISTAELDTVLDELRSGRRDDIPDHGTLAKVRQHIPVARRAGNVAPTDVAEPVWLGRNATSTDADGKAGA